MTRFHRLHGLFSDPQKKLLDAAEAMLTVGEKAVPWAGAAAKLVTAKGSLAVEPIDGHMYCGLPLTDQTPLPVHINGYFDLDSSRRALSADRNVIGANRVGEHPFSLLLMGTLSEKMVASGKEFLAGCSQGASRRDLTPACSHDASVS